MAAKLESTYKRPATQVPRLALLTPYSRLVTLYSEGNKAEQVFKTALKVLKSLGFVIKGAKFSNTKGDFRVEKWGLMVDEVIAMFIHLCNVYITFAPHLVPQAAACAKLAYKIWVGEDVTFKENHDKDGILGVY